MGKFKNRLYRMMAGRYGSDTLNKVLLWVYVAVVLVYTVVSLFVKQSTTKTVLALVYALLTLSLVFLIFFRMFSRNVVKRRRENERFCRFFRLIRNRFRDRKTHVYRKCPKCRAVLRLPKAKGRHGVTCPRCREHFEVKG